MYAFFSPPFASPLVYSQALLFLLEMGSREKFLRMIAPSLSSGCFIFAVPLKVRAPFLSSSLHGVVSLLINGACPCTPPLSEKEVTDATFPLGLSTVFFQHFFFSERQDLGIVLLLFHGLISLPGIQSSDFSTPSGVHLSVPFSSPSFPPVRTRYNDLLPPTACGTSLCPLPFVRVTAGKASSSSRFPPFPNDPLLFSHRPPTATLCSLPSFPVRA